MTTTRGRPIAWVAGTWPTSPDGRPMVTTHSVIVVDVPADALSPGGTITIDTRGWSR